MHVTKNSSWLIKLNDLEVCPHNKSTKSVRNMIKFSIFSWTRKSELSNDFGQITYDDTFSYEMWSNINTFKAVICAVHRSPRRSADEKKIWIKGKLRFKTTTVLKLKDLLLQLTLFTVTKHDEKVFSSPLTL